MKTLDDRLLLVCGLSWGAGMIHVAAAIDHFVEWVPFAVFFALLAGAQFLWGVVICRVPRRRLLFAGAVANLMVAALWIVSRTTGLPIGPEPWSPEAVGAIDAIATADEVLLAFIVTLHLGAGRVGALLRASSYAATAAGVCLILLSSLSLAIGSHH